MEKIYYYAYLNHEVGYIQITKADYGRLIELGYAVRVNKIENDVFKFVDSEKRA